MLAIKFKVIYLGR